MPWDPEKKEFESLNRKKGPFERCSVSGSHEAAVVGGPLSGYQSQRLICGGSRPQQTSRQGLSQQHTRTEVPYPQGPACALN